MNTIQTSGSREAASQRTLPGSPIFRNNQKD